MQDQASKHIKMFARLYQMVFTLIGLFHYCYEQRRCSLIENEEHVSLVNDVDISIGSRI